MEKLDEERIKTTLLMLDEKQRRIYLAIEAKRMGRGGIAAISRVTGVSRNTIISGYKDLEKLRSDGAYSQKRQENIRNVGAGRKKAEEIDPDLEKAFWNQICHKGPLFYTVKGARSLAATLTSKGHPVSHAKIVSMMRGFGFDLDSSRGGPLSKDSLKERESAFKKINSAVNESLDEENPVIALSIKNNATFAGLNENCEVFYDSNCGVFERKNSSEEISKRGNWDSFITDFILQWWGSSGSFFHPNPKKLLICLDLSTFRRKVSLDFIKSSLEHQLGLEVVLMPLPYGAYAWRKLSHPVIATYVFESSQPCQIKVGFAE